MLSCRLRHLRLEASVLTMTRLLLVLAAAAVLKTTKLRLVLASAAVLVQNARPSEREFAKIRWVDDVASIDPVYHQNHCLHLLVLIATLVLMVSMQVSPALLPLVDPIACDLVLQGHVRHPSLVLEESVAVVVKLLHHLQ